MPCRRSLNKVCSCSLSLAPAQIGVASLQWRKWRRRRFLRRLDSPLRFPQRKSGWTFSHSKFFSYTAQQRRQKRKRSSEFSSSPFLFSPTNCANLKKTLMPPVFLRRRYIFSLFYANGRGSEIRNFRPQSLKELFCKVCFFTAKKGENGAYLVATLHTCFSVFMWVRNLSTNGRSKTRKVSMYTICCKKCHTYNV